MNRRRKNYQETENFDITNAFTDLMSNAFMILSFFLILIILQLWQGKKEQLMLRQKGENLLKIEEQLKQLQAENQELKKQNQTLYNASPIIIDEKSGNFKFPSGSAQLSSELRKYIVNTIAPQIKQVLNNQEIDFIQVIGHTDGQVLGSRGGNLDHNLEKVAQNQMAVTQLTPGSNGDLALMRAFAVVQELQKQGEFNNVKFRAYSGAQLYLPSGELAPLNRQQDEARRRIEIRFIPPGQKQN